MQHARYVRLYADKSGETHFEDLQVLMLPQESVPQAAPLNVAKFLPVDGSFWVGAPGDWSGDMPHASPGRQLLCTVEGEYEITASDGEVRCFPAGSVLLVENISGKGYQTNITYDKGVLVFAVSLADENGSSRRN